MAISKDEVRHVANLARLAITEDEVERFTGQLDRILESMAKLRELDTEGVPPTSHPLSLANVMREDEPRRWFGEEEALANAPDPQPPYFRVPRVVQHGGEGE